MPTSRFFSRILPVLSAGLTRHSRIGIRVACAVRFRAVLYEPMGLQIAQHSSYRRAIGPNVLFIYLEPYGTSALTALNSWEEVEVPALCLNRFACMRSLRRTDARFSCKACFPVGSPARAGLKLLWHLKSSEGLHTCLHVDIYIYIYIYVHTCI